MRKWQGLRSVFWSAPTGYLYNPLLETARFRVLCAVYPHLWLNSEARREETREVVDITQRAQQTTVPYKTLTLRECK